MSDVPFPMPKRKKKILKAMYALGCRTDVSVTTRQIAEKTNLRVNGVAQTLGRMQFDVFSCGGQKGETQWRLRNYFAATL